MSRTYRIMSIVILTLFTHSGLHAIEDHSDILEAIKDAFSRLQINVIVNNHPNNQIEQKTHVDVKASPKNTANAKNNNKPNTVSTKTTTTTANKNIDASSRNANKLDNLTANANKPTTNASPSNMADSSPSNLTDSSPSNLTDSSPSNLTDSSPSNLTDSSPSNLTDSSPSNLTDSSPSNLTDSSPSNLTDSSPSSRTDNLTKLKAPSTTQSNANSSNNTQRNKQTLKPNNTDQDFTQPLSDRQKLNDTKSVSPEAINPPNMSTKAPSDHRPFLSRHKKKLIFIGMVGAYCGIRWYGRYLEDKVKNNNDWGS
ncbi:hypothetical protein HOB95_00560, partial [bacterium]|nr:hypothetical protein [bacterium]